ncbi:MAG: VWA domain-containing protein [Desulfobacterota bacterium]|nr:VWA domain-containing protein [Thermodesulfobacteriota bacterium]
MMVRLQAPWLLLAVCAVIALVYWDIRRRATSAVRFSSLEVIEKIPRTRKIVLQRGLRLMRYLALVLLVIALARPQAGEKTTDIPSEGIDIMLCLDTSGSMRALDFTEGDTRVTRLQVVKRVVGEFIRGRTSDRIGMVVFGAEAFTQCPLTLDYGVLLSFLERLDIGMAGDTTAIGSGLGLSVKRLKDSPSKSKVIILLTDGRNNTGSIGPGVAADLARAYGIKVYTIGVGTESEAPFLVDSLFGKQYVYQKVDLDEETLKKIAETTGGAYFRATNTEALEMIYRQIDAMEKTEVTALEHREYHELAPWFLIPALLLIVAEIVLAQTWLRKIP